MAVVSDPARAFRVGNRFISFSKNEQIFEVSFC